MLELRDYSNIQIENLKDTATIYERYMRGLNIFYEKVK